MTAPAAGADQQEIDAFELYKQRMSKAYDYRADYIRAKARHAP